MTEIEILQAELMNNQNPLYCTRKELCDAVDYAEEALREKQEREKGCEYCKPPYKKLLNIELGEFENGDPLNLYVETDGQNIRAYDNDPRSTEIHATRINRCPMCGRKLGECDG